MCKYLQDDCLVTKRLHDYLQGIHLLGSLRLFILRRPLGVTAIALLAAISVFTTLRLLALLAVEVELDGFVETLVFKALLENVLLAILN